jgi:Domain of unknown function (DUF2017)
VGDAVAGFVKVSRRGEQVRVRFDAAELTLLGGVLDELAEALGVLDAGDAVYDRLHPAAYADADAAAEFRELVTGEADRLRAGRIAACRRELADSAGDLRLSPEAGEQWLVTLNDLRLAIGTRLGITAEGDTEPADPRAGEDAGRLVYHWLTWLQDALVEAVMR